MDYCLYHVADLDGICSANIVKLKFPNVKLVPMDYGYEFDETFSEYKGKDICMVDFCFQPFSHMENLNEITNSFIWIDHHKSEFINERKSMYLFEGIRKEGIAGCELTWNYFFPDKEMPKAVWYLGRYDVWDHQQYVMEFQYGMRTMNSTVDSNLWNRLLHDNEIYFRINIEEEIIKRGRIALEYQTKTNSILCKALAIDTELDSYKAVAINVGLANSQMFKDKWETGDYDIMIAYSRRPGYWKVSLYCDNTGKSGMVDTSVISVKFGGGGHAGASGFECKELPFKV